MRGKREITVSDFIDGAKGEEQLPPPQEVEIKGELERYEALGLVYAQGSRIAELPLNMRVKEVLWNTIDQHCRRISRSRAEWAREAMAEKLIREQGEER